MQARFDFSDCVTCKISPTKKKWSCAIVSFGEYDSIKATSEIQTWQDNLVLFLSTQLVAWILY
jgi:hypothetical protein